MNNEHIVVAMDSFKGSATSNQLANWLEKGVHRVDEGIKVTKIPIADGGEGTVEALTKALKGSFVEVEVKGSLGDKTKAQFGMIQNNTAVIEMAQSNGITLIEQNEENALKASSFGLGEVIKAALDNGAKEIYVGIGGSATNDGGVGMAKALGVTFLTKDGKDISSGVEGLKDIATVNISKIDPRIKETAIHILSDVKNPLTGEKGAIHVYGKQKGIPVNRLDEVDKWMTHYAEVVHKDLGIDISTVPGAGAAGGVGAALMTFCQADLYQGIDKILDLLDVDHLMNSATAVFTGEGFLDGQTANGKAPMGILTLAKKHNLPVIAIAGGCDDDLSAIYKIGFDLIITAVNRPMSLKDAMEQVEKNIINAGETAIRALSLKKKGE